MAVTPAIDEGGSVILTGTILDTSSAVSRTLSVNWGDGSAVQEILLDAAATSFSIEHVYAQDSLDAIDGVYAISASIANEHGFSSAFTGDLLSVDVANVDPTLTDLTLDPRVTENQLATLSGTVADAGILDSHVVTIDWGDGSPLQVLDNIASNGLFNETHAYSDIPSGPDDVAFNVRVTVSDEAGGTSVSEIPISVTPENSVPTDITLVTNQVNENIDTSLASLFVSAFGVVDVEPFDTHTFQFVTGVGSADNSKFEIIGDRLYLKQNQVLDFELQGEYKIRVVVTDSASNQFEKELTVGVANLPEVTEVRINDGEAQRSSLRSVKVFFDQLITEDTSAFELVRRGAVPQAFAAEDIHVSFRKEDNRSVATLTFSGEMTRPSGSLIDGNYMFTIDGQAIRSLADDRALDGSSNGTPGGDFVFGDEEVDNFFAHFGDSDGDRDVDGIDLGAFGQTFRKQTGQAGFDPLFDFDGDGDVDGSDLGQFGLRFRERLNF